MNIEHGYWKNGSFMENENDVLYIVVPAYNEQDNIGNLIDDWYPVVEKHNGAGKSRLVIVNDGSKGNTSAIVSEKSKNLPLLVALDKPNGGHGSTVLFGYRYAIENGADWIFQTDSDGQTDPKEFDAFWDARMTHDAIIGNRSDRQDGSSRRFVEKTLLFILRMTFGVKMPDSNAPFRLMKRELVAKYIDKMPRDYNLPNVMFSTYFVYFHENIEFRHVTFKPRQGGINSINMKKIFGIGKKALRDFRYLKQHIDDDTKPIEDSNGNLVPSVR